MKKRFVCLLLVLIMVLSMVPVASAVAMDKDSAEILYELGLFRGTGTNADGTPIFDLEKTPTRNQAIIMMVRLLGKEEEALAGDWELPFTDVVKGSTSYYYIGYAYANGLTNGTTATTYSGGNPIRANQYITFVLRSLGYVSGEDFNVSTAWELSDKLGITDGRYNQHTAGDFSRGDVANISMDALAGVQKGKEETLAEKLIGDEVFTRSQYEKAVEDITPPKENPAPDYKNTAFGSRALHDFLMSHDPDEVVLANEGRHDLYVYNGVFIEAKLRRVVADMFSSFTVQENYTKLKNPPLVGTRVECLYNKGSGCHISIQTFTKNGDFYETTYGMRFDEPA